MSEIKLEAKKRRPELKAKNLLLESIVPAVVYGPKTESFGVELDYQEFRKALQKAKKGRILDLVVEGKTYEVLVKDYTFDPIYDTFSHVDFLAVDKDTEVLAEIPVSLFGESQALRLGGVLRQEMDSVKVKALPGKLPNSFELSIEKLSHFKAVLKVSDIEKIDGVELLSDENLIVASIIVPRSVAAAAAKSDTETKSE